MEKWNYWQVWECSYCKAPFLTIEREFLEYYVCIHCKADCKPLKTMVIPED